MRKKISVSDEDLALFKDAVGPVKRLKETDKIAPSPPRQPLRRKKIAIPEEISLSPLSQDDLPLVQAEEFIQFKQQGISDKILRKLRKGQYNVEAILDLHGMRVDEAYTAVCRFISTCQSRDVRVALIVHGKGQHSAKPMLKNKLNHWLREMDTVLAFCSAQPANGSRGAVYVLLKRMREENIV